MAEIFRSFAEGLSTGAAQRDDRDRRSALDEARRLYGADNYEGAEQAALAYSPELAGTFSALSEARRNRNTRGAVSEAMQGLDPNAAPDARLQAGATAALEAGDTDQWLAFQQAATQMSAQERQVAGERAQFIGSAAASLLSVPVEQRAEQARALLAASPYANDAQILQMIDDAPELTDEALNAAARSTMTAAEILGFDRQQEQFDQQIALQRANAFGPRLNAPQVRAFGNDYERGLRQITDTLGPQIMNAMPWATRVAQGGLVPEGVSRDSALINDQGMLRAVARLQTGVGVLTEGEVRDTIGNDVFSQMQRLGADFRLTTPLTESKRQALAALVQTGVTRASNQAWNYRQSALDEYRSLSGGQDPVGWQLPSIAHPEDFAALNAAEGMAGTNGAPALTPNAIRIAPSGRRYQYMGPGNWLPVAEGDVEGYQAGREQRIARGGSPTAPSASQSGGWRPGQPVPQAAIERVRSNPALLNEFKRTFNLSDEEARRLTGLGQNARPDGPMRRG